MNIVIEYDSSAQNAPAGFKTAVQAAVQFMDYLIADPITVPIVFSYGEVQGQSLPSNAIGESSTNGNIENFSSLVNLLTAAASSPTAKAALAALPTTDPTNGGQFWVSDAMAQAFGLGSEPGYTDPEDGFVGVSSKLPLTWDPNNRSVAGEYDAVGTIEHEISEVLGRVSYLANGPTFQGYNLYAPLDLFRYSGPGVHTLAYTSGYFSVNGTTMLLPFNNPSNGGDAGDWASSVVGDSFGSGFAGISSLVSQTDAQVMNVLGFQVAPFGSPVAGAAPTLTAVNGAQAPIAESALTGLITNDYTGDLTILSASLDAAYASDGTLSINSANQTVVFTPAAGFAGTATGSVTISDNNGGTVSQPIDFNVVVQASAPVVTPPNTTTTTVNGNVTTIQTFSPTGTLISTEVITVNGGQTVTTWSNASGTQTAATIQQVNGNETQFQTFDGAWNQQSASITFNYGGGDTVVQNFNGAWTMTGATVTTVNGAATIVQNFNPSWVQTSATITTVNGNMTETQNFDASWNQTSANLTYNLGGGAVESQNFNASWQQTSATLTSHPAANQTETQYFNASWAQTGASMVTVANGQTTTQSFNASWAQTGVTVDTPNPGSALSDRFDTYGPSWNLLTEVDTAINTGQSYFVWGQAGGGQSFTAASGHSTTFIFAPGTLNGDSIAGLHTLNLGGAIHDVIDFQGYGAGAHLVQVNATQWQIVATGDATETFTLTGGAALAAGDYAFVAAGVTLTAASVGTGANSAGAGGSVTVSSGGGVGVTAISVGAGAGGISIPPATGAVVVAPTSTASVALFNQFAAAGLGAPADGGAGQLIVAPVGHAGTMIAPPRQA